MTTKLPKIEISSEQRELLEVAASRPWVNRAWVERTARPRARGRAPLDGLDDAFREQLNRQRAEQDAELADAERRLEAQELFTRLALKVFNLRYWKTNAREGHCAVTGEIVPEDRGLLVQTKTGWKVYSRKGVLSEILLAASMSHDLHEEVGPQ